MTPPNKVMCFLVFSLPVLSYHYKIWIFPHILPTLLPLTSISLTGSLYCVIALSFERYFSISNSAQQNKGSFFGYILPVLVFSICFNFPKFFEFFTNYTYSDKWQYYVPYLEATQFRESPDYSFYVLGSSFIFLGLLPFSVLIILNLIIARKVRNNFISHEISESLMSLFLYSIVMAQLISHVPRTALNIYEIYMAFTSSSISISYSWLVDLSHLLLAISSSLNVVIYSAQDMRFRTLLLDQLKKSLHLYKTSSRSQFEPVEEGKISDVTDKCLTVDVLKQHECLDVNYLQVNNTQSTCEPVTSITRLLQ
eukprot:GFUD01058164.1.p1 GENE.GFUD01058164.1~~GFUD01058164.1.p1  ORF type:complete len:310 (-),score=31.81 GFUD01058164.1:207-1136(-)